MMSTASGPGDDLSGEFLKRFQLIRFEHLADAQKVLKHPPLNLIPNSGDCVGLSSHRAHVDFRDRKEVSQHTAFLVYAVHEGTQLLEKSIPRRGQDLRLLG